MYLIIPDEGFKLLADTGAPQFRKLNLHKRVPIVLLNDHYEAIIVTTRRKVLIEEWKLPPDAPYIIEGRTLSEYADDAGISRQAVHQKIKSGKLKAERIGGLWIIFGNQNTSGS